MRGVTCVILGLINIPHAGDLMDPNASVSLGGLVKWALNLPTLLLMIECLTLVLVEEICVSGSNKWDREEYQPCVLKKLANLVCLESILCLSYGAEAWSISVLYIAKNLCYQVII